MSLNTIKTQILKPDSIGSIASALCIIHCIATPFIFITQACIAHACAVACCAESPVWWQSLDYIFIIISFFAIFKATQTSSNKIINTLLWIIWTLFLLLIINSTVQLWDINQTFTYIIGITLAILHLYNLKYCQCSNEKCCIENH